MLAFKITKQKIFFILLFAFVILLFLPLTSYAFGWEDVAGYLGVPTLDSMSNGLLNLIAKMAFGIIYVLTRILIWASQAFNVAIDYTIINFATQFETIQGSVDTIWTAFRDMANIFMIGMVVYIAFRFI